MLIKVWSLFADEGSPGKQTRVPSGIPARLALAGQASRRSPFPRVQRGPLRKCSERAKGGGAGGRGAAGASVQTFVEICAASVRSETRNLSSSRHSSPHLAGDGPPASPRWGAGRRTTLSLSQWAVRVRAPGRTPPTLWVLQPLPSGNVGRLHLGFCQLCLLNYITSLMPTTPDRLP